MNSSRSNVISASTRLAATPAPQQLRSRYLDLLRDGDRAPAFGEYRSRSEAVRAVTLAMVNAGWSWSDFHAAMTDPRNVLSDWFVTRGDGRRRTDTVKRLSQQWDGAAQRAIDHPSLDNRADALQEVGHIIAAAQAHDWPGRNGKRDRAVFFALCTIATAHATLTPTVSVRTLCERTSYRSAQTVVNALHSLTTAGLVKVVRAAIADAPNSYRLQAPRGAREMDMITLTTGVRDYVQSSRTPDVALVLGEHAAAVYAAVDVDEPLSARAVARLAGVGSRTADRWLAELHRDGLVAHPHGEATWIRTMHDPAVALGAESALISLERSTRHALQRRGFREARDRLALAGGTTSPVSAQVRSPAAVLAFPARPLTTARLAHTGREEVTAA